MTPLSTEKIQMANWQVETPLSYPDEPTRFTLRTAIEIPEVVTTNHTRVAMVNDPLLPTVWSGVVYPHTAGWHTLALAKDTTSTHTFYVMDSSHWHSRKLYERTEINRHHFNNQKQVTSEKTTEEHPVNRIWLFLVFVLTIGYLWAEPRFGW